MITRQEAESLARKIALAKHKNMQKSARISHMPRFSPFHMPSYVNGFLEAYDLMKKQQTETKEVK